MSADTLGAREAPKHPGWDVNLSALRKSLPPHIFEKSLPRSLFHFVFDGLVLAGLYYGYSQTLAQREKWSLLEWAAYAVWMQVVGLFMWSMFCIGHDCGHGSFSNYKKINAVVGHISHGFLLVPFWPWARSHAQHHAYHNHKEKDMSHPWSTREEETAGAKVLKGQPLLVPWAYGIGYLLVGWTDGSHFVPWSKLFRNTRERVQCVVSSGIVFLYAVALRLAAGTWSALFWGYICPWLVYNTWLYAVTYLQHHAPDTRVYSDENWTFTTGAVQTVDRTYGMGILDWFMHNITDGHVVHHLFYTSIPHYRLMEATPLVAKSLGSSYRHVTGFPLMEFLKSHWHSTRAYLMWSAEERIWTMTKRDQLNNKKVQ
ncbi:fatty acid desaturase-domain-containing protein [Gaertneriomyces semiglobifer]|nr:fatty acid desaturase-domain-containing protein [Gaertneriomyces semiglobifer]